MTENTRQIGAFAVCAEDVAAANQRPRIVVQIERTSAASRSVHEGGVFTMTPAELRDLARFLNECATEAERDQATS